MQHPSSLTGSGFLNQLHFLLKLSEWAVKILAEQFLGFWLPVIRKLQLSISIETPTLSVTQERHCLGDYGKADPGR